MFTMLRAVVLKEVRQTLRDRRMMFMLLVAPLLQLVIFGYAVNLDVDRIPTVVVDRDDTTTSRRDVRRLFADGTLIEAARATDDSQVARLLEDGTVAVALVVPAGYQRHLMRGTGAEVQVIADGTDPNRSGVALAAAGNYFATVSEGLIAARLTRLRHAGRASTAPAQVQLVPRVWNNPRLQTAIFMVPGVAAILLLLITTIVTSMGLAREREMGTLEQVQVTPLPAYVVIVGKILPFLAVGLIDFIAAMTAGAFLFDMPIRGSVGILIVATLLYLMTTLGVGLFISSVSRSQQQAFMGGFIFMLPAMLLSGTLTPVHSMPAWMQSVTYANPVRYYVDALRVTLLEGGTIRDVAVQLGALAALGIAIVTVATIRFKRTLGKP